MFFLKSMLCVVVIQAYDTSNEILPPFKTFKAIPSDVGPNTAPEAMIAFQSPTSIAQAMRIPTPIGRKLPTTAIIKPLVPTKFITAISISIPASITNKIRLQYNKGEMVGPFESNKLETKRANQMKTDDGCCIAHCTALTPLHRSKPMPLRWEQYWQAEDPIKYHRKSLPPNSAFLAHETQIARAHKWR